MPRGKKESTNQNIEKSKRNKSGSESEEVSESEEEEAIDPANDSRMAEVFRLTEDKKD